MKPQPARRSSSQSSLFRRRPHPAARRSRPIVSRNIFHSPETNNGRVAPARLQQRNWQRTVQFIFFAILLLIFISVHSYFLFIVPRVKNISCVQIDGGACSPAVTDTLKKSHGKLLYLLSDQKIQHTLQQTDPTVTQVNVRRRLPTTIEVTIQIEQPLFLIEKEGQYFAVFPSQQVLPTSINQQLPVIHASTELSWSDNVLSTQLFTSLKQLTEYNWQFLNITSLSYLDATQIEVQLNNKKILFSLYEIPQQLYTLSVIQQQPALFEQNWLELDLRFDKPVVRYEDQDVSEATSSSAVNE